MASLFFLSAVICFTINTVIGEGLKTCADIDLSSGLNPHPHDCKKYLECEDGQLRERTCPGTSVFNPRIYNCDHPSSVPGCKSVTSTTPPSTTSSSPMTSKKTTKIVPIDENSLCYDLKLPNGIYPNPLHCSRFIQCANGITYIFNCPRSLKYNMKTKVCDYARNVNCSKNHNFKGHSR